MIARRNSVLSHTRNVYTKCTRFICRPTGNDGERTFETVQFNWQTLRDQFCSKLFHVNLIEKPSQEVVSYQRTLNSLVDDIRNASIFKLSCFSEGGINIKWIEYFNQLLCKQLLALCFVLMSMIFLIFFLLLWPLLNTHCNPIRGNHVSNVARVQLPASTPYVAWVCCWFSPLLREVFLRVLRFFPLLKNQHFDPNSNSICNAWTRLNEFIWTPMCFVGKQAIYIFFCFNAHGPLLFRYKLPLKTVISWDDAYSFELF